MTYTDDTHTYEHEGKRYTSVTSLYKKYKPKKDWDEIAEKYASKHGQTKEYWLEKWAQNRKESAEFGTMYHSLREHGDVKTPELKKDAIDLNHLEGTYKEIIVYSHRFRVAGQVDVLEVKDNVVRLRDYKTCKSIETEGFKKYKKGLGKVADKYMPPISHLEVFNLNDFSLQLSIYAYLLELYGYEIDRLIIEHVTFKERDKGYLHLLDSIKSNNLQEESVDYEVPYLREEAKALLKHHINTLCQ